MLGSEKLLLLGINATFPFVLGGKKLMFLGVFDDFCPFLMVKYSVIKDILDPQNR
jgi:hypothetical protein